MKVLQVSDAKAKLGRVIDQVIKTQEPVVIPRGEHHVVIMPYELATPDEQVLAAIGKKMNESGVDVPEDDEHQEIIQAEIRKYRAEKRRSNR